MRLLTNYVHLPSPQLQCSATPALKPGQSLDRGRHAGADLLRPSRTNLLNDLWQTCPSLAWIPTPSGPPVFNLSGADSRASFVSKPRPRRHVSALVVAIIKSLHPYRCGRKRALNAAFPERFWWHFLDRADERLLLTGWMSCPRSSRVRRLKPKSENRESEMSQSLVTSAATRK